MSIDEAFTVDGTLIENCFLFLFLVTFLVLSINTHDRPFSIQIGMGHHHGKAPIEATLFNCHFSNSVKFQHFR